ncbi:MAG: hypothetical protein KAU21_18980 [Gammaproteobacteria bacterium]|nr:hypothetical protein [Gammaproteobacteria bacterium]
MTDKKSQDIDIQEVGGFRFHRGSALSLFGSDRREDLLALMLSLFIAIGVYLLV